MDERIQSEKGQSLVLVALLLIAFLAILAVVLDGGFAYFQRRNAQNAADAGALAGARVFCEDPDANYDAAIQTATDYVASNEASLLPGYPDITGNKVTVGTTITHDTYFGRIIGRDEVVVNAVAQAGCYQPCLGEGVLPVVWTCKPRDAGVPAGTKACEDLPIPLDTLERYRDNPPTPPCFSVSYKGQNPPGKVCPELTIVMDNIDVDTLQCISSGGLIDCDFNNDGRDDYISASNRGWSDLDGNVNAFYSCPPNSEGEVELRDWILNGYDCPLTVHTWVGDQSGNAAELYATVEDRRKTNPIVVLPVFDTSCPEDPTGGAGGCDWHEPSPEFSRGDLVHEYTAGTNYYHIDHFSAFYITCVQKKNGQCPGATQFYKDNEAYFKGGGDDITGNKYMAIEGYFLSGYVPGMKGNCGDEIDTGIFTIYLDK